MCSSTSEQEHINGVLQAPAQVGFAGDVLQHVDEEPRHLRLGLPGHTRREEKHVRMAAAPQRAGTEIYEL